MAIGGNRLGKQLGGDGARRNRVHCDAIGGQLKRPSVRASHDGAFGGSVAGCLAGATHSQTAQIDDTTTAPRFHALDECLRDLQRSSHVQIKGFKQGGEINSTQRL